MAITEPVTGTLSDAAQATTGKALQDTLVDLLDLSLVAKQAHWNLVGRQFRDVHLHLDDLVATARSYADDVAERAAAIGVSPDGRIRTIAEKSGVPPIAEGWITDRDTVHYIFEAVDAVVRKIRPRIEETDKSDLVTQDLFIGIVGALEEARWMWQAQKAGYDS